ncbi:MAG: hypothetical protein OXT03_00665 [Alphaproteobacteria bacterium]|nr:hypothetical protein [Alphaproteobacteria bacterium]
MLHKKILILAFSATLLSACAISTPAPLTPLEIQTIQTRQFEEDKSIVFASVISVFQDLGYTISNADKDTGLISAESATQSDEASQFFTGMLASSQTKATGFVERIGDFTRVRLNFVSTTHTSSLYGQTSRKDKPILDTVVYENAFEKIANAIFVRSAN